MQEFGKEPLMDAGIYCKSENILWVLFGEGFEVM